METAKVITLAVVGLIIIASVWNLVLLIKRIREHEKATKTLKEMADIQEDARKRLNYLISNGRTFTSYYALSASDFNKTEEKMMRDIETRMGGDLGRQIVKQFKPEPIAVEGSVVGYEVSVDVTPMLDPGKLE